MLTRPTLHCWFGIAADETEGNEAVRQEVVDVLRAQLTPNSSADELSDHGCVRLTVQALGDRVKERGDLYDLAIFAPDEPGALLERWSVELTQQLDAVGKLPVSHRSIARRLGIQLRKRGHLATPTPKKDEGGRASGVLALPPSATRDQLQNSNNDGVPAQVAVQGSVADTEGAVPITVSLSVEVVAVAASAATSATHHFASRNEFNNLELHLFYGKCHEWFLSR
jgi:hypothetical protein